MKLKAQLLDESTIEKTIKRLSHEIIEKVDDLSNSVLIGIRRRGVPIAQELAKYIKEFSGISLPVGELDITLYRDDLTTLSDAAVINGSSIPFELKNKKLRNFNASLHGVITEAKFTISRDQVKKKRKER